MSTTPQRIGKYELQERLRQQTYESIVEASRKPEVFHSEVWKALDTQLRRNVAITVITADGEANMAFRARFEREVKTISSLLHPNIARIHDFFFTNVVGGMQALLVMDYVEGETLADFLQGTSHARNFPSVDFIIHLFATLSNAIDYAHQKGILHQTITPEAILLEFRNTALPMPVITDFGIAQIVGTTVRGNPYYTSPEQAKGVPAGAASDIYSLGVILYEICTGIAPFQGESSSAVLAQQINVLPTTPSLIHQNILPALNMVILKSMAKDPAMRFASASSMVAALAEAFNVPIPDDVLQPGSLGGATDIPTFVTPLFRTSSSAEPLPAVEMTRMNSQLGRDTPNGAISPLPLPVGTDYMARASADSSGGAPLASSTPSLQNIPVGDSHTPQSNSTRLLTPSEESAQQRQATMNITPAGHMPSSAPKRKRRVLLITLVALLLLLIGSSLGAFFLLSAHKSAVATKPIVGYAYFGSSGLLSTNTANGINDQLDIHLQNMHSPAVGKSYYAWLMGDKNSTEPATLSLGILAFSKGVGHDFYQGDSSHTNLLNQYSQLLITEEATDPAPLRPSHDQSTWLYYAALPQAVKASSSNHSSPLSHLRSLLASDPTLDTIGQRGGLAIWLLRNTGKIMEWSGSARDDWHTQDVASMSNQFVRILDFLDGKTSVQADVPAGTPLMADSQIALLNLDPHDQTDYLHQVSMHLQGILTSPSITTDRQKSIEQIMLFIKNVTSWLSKVRQDAKQLALMNKAQLLQPATLSLLDDMTASSLYAYVGRLDPATNVVQGGTVQINYGLERLAHFDIRPYR